MMRVPWIRTFQLAILLLPGMAACLLAGCAPAREGQVIYLHPAGADAQIWVSDADPSQRENRQLTDHKGGILDYSVTKDGHKIIFSAANSSGGYDLWSINRSGKNAEMVLDCGSDWCVESAANPAGDLVAYCRYKNGPEQGNLDAPGRISFIDLNTKIQQNYAGSASWSGRQPGWSPDGAVLTFYDPAGGGIRVVERESGRETFLAGIPGEKGSWSPDGKLLLYLVRLEAGMQTATQLVTANLETRRIEPLSATLGSIREFSTPVWSPDGKWIALSRRQTGGAFSGEIWLYSLDGSEAFPVSEDASYRYALPRWHPDGEKLVFQRTAGGSSAAVPEVIVWDQSTRQSILIAEDAFLADWLP